MEDSFGEPEHMRLSSRVMADRGEAEVREAQQAFGHCWEARDAICMDKLLASDFDWVNRRGHKQDKAAFLAMVKGGDISPAFRLPADALIRFYGPVAVVTLAHTGVHVTLLWSRAESDCWLLVQGVIAVYEPDLGLTERPVTPMSRALVDTSQKAGT
jgi:hypothetical protein